MIGECLPRQRSREFIRFLAKIDRETPADLDLHLIVDNSNTHKSPPVKRWLRRQPRDSPALHPDEQFVAQHGGALVWRDHAKRIRRGTFRSVPELVTAITEYLRLYNQAPTRFVWTKHAGYT